jgi:hypothetical protein
MTKLLIGALGLALLGLGGLVVGLDGFDAEPERAVSVPTTTGETTTGETTTTTGTSTAGATTAGGDDDRDDDRQDDDHEDDDRSGSNSGPS